MIISVIGSHHGDEGKGLAVDYFASRSKSALVIRHNGGAQSGHTVEIRVNKVDPVETRDNKVIPEETKGNKDNLEGECDDEAGSKSKRFVFHELSSGSFRKADTFWAATYMPDLYKLSDEIADFYSVSGIIPTIYADKDCCVTTIDDVLINMLLETARGDKRHGSCGMGIYEADLRNSAGYGISMGRLMDMSVDELFLELKRIREAYSCQRVAKELREEVPAEAPEETPKEVPKEVPEETPKETSEGDWINASILSQQTCEYLTFLQDDEILYNYCVTVIANLKYVTVADLDTLLDRYENVIFEAGQGLLLDAECQESQPHVTGSRTGLTNVLQILGGMNRKLDEVVYVTRTYGTKHGAGPLKNEDCLVNREILFDQTNIYNEWQGYIRYYAWDNLEDFMRPILQDAKLCTYDVSRALFVTHLNETNRQMLLQDGLVSVEDLQTGNFFNRLYLSDSHFAEDVELKVKK